MSILERNPVMEAFPHPTAYKGNHIGILVYISGTAEFG